MLGQLCGDALGSSAETVVPVRMPLADLNAVRDIKGGGPFNTAAGQVSDASEMALALARHLADDGRFDPASAKDAYLDWLNSVPFDCQEAVAAGLCGNPDPGSQSNGALMRVSPIGIFGAGRDIEDVGEWAMLDAAITHPNPVCVQANRLFAMAIAYSIQSGARRDDVFVALRGWADEAELPKELTDAIEGANSEPWIEKSYQWTDWVVVAFQNALWQLRNADSLEEGIIDTVSRGGDANANAAVCGALLGAVHGIESVPERWSEAVLACRPDVGARNILQPRPKSCWASDALVLVDRMNSWKRGK